MRDRDFEKSFQRKANELRIDPSPELWDRVAVQIQEKDRKRGGAWIWLAAAMIAGGLAVWFLGPTFMNDKGAAQQVAGKNQGTTENTPESTGLASTTHTTEKNTKAGSDQLNGEFSNPNAQPNEKPSDLITGSRAGATAAQKRNRAIRSGHDRLATTADYLAGNNSGTTQTGKIAGSGGEAVADKSNSVALADETGEALLNSKYPTLAAIEHAPGEISISDAEEGDTKLSASLLENIPAAPEKQKDGWNLGVLAGGGTGSLRDGLATSYQTPNETFSAGSLIGNAPITNAAPEPNPSSVRSGPAFQVGVGFSRPVSRRLTFNTGLQYAYSSSRIEVGQKIDQNTANANFRLQSIAGTEAYAGVGNKGTAYYNAYHYAQLPMELGWALDNRKRLSWNNGLVLGYLISTDALHYNSFAGAYYKDNSLVNKWQTNIQTSFQYLVFPGTQWNFSVGPYASYQLRNIDKTPGDKRLLSVGLNARIVFNK